MSYMTVWQQSILSDEDKKVLCESLQWRCKDSQEKLQESYKNTPFTSFYQLGTSHVKSGEMPPKWIAPASLW